MARPKKDTKAPKSTKTAAPAAPPTPPPAPASPAAPAASGMSDELRALMGLGPSAPMIGAAQGHAPYTETVPEHKSEPVTEDWAGTLKLICEFSGVKNTDFADALGVSRVSLSNYINGKQEFNPSDAQKNVVRKTLALYRDKLMEAAVKIGL